MKFKEASELYLISADFLRLDEATSQNVYRQNIKLLIACLGDYEFASSLEGSSAVANGMPMAVAVAHDASVVYTALRGIKSESRKRLARTVFLIVWRWLERNGLTNQGVAEKIPSFRVKERDVRALSPKKLEEAMRRRIPDWMVPYRAMAALCFYSGMRPAEAENLMWEDVGPEYIEIKHAKGRNKGTVARLCKITSQIREVLPERKESGLVFASLAGKKLNKDMRSRTARKLFGMDFYATRRGTATEMHKSGKYDIQAIASQLGHRNINTTQLYIRPTMLERANTFGGI